MLFNRIASGHFKRNNWKNLRKYKEIISIHLLLQHSIILNTMFLSSFFLLLFSFFLPSSTLLHTHSIFFFFLFLEYTLYLPQWPEERFGPVFNNSTQSTGCALLTLCVSVSGQPIDVLTQSWQPGRPQEGIGNPSLHTCNLLPIHRDISPSSAARHIYGHTSPGTPKFNYPIFSITGRAEGVVLLCRTKAASDVLRIQTEGCSFKRGTHFLFFSIARKHPCRFLFYSYYLGSLSE